MSNKNAGKQILTGVRNLDALIGGGLPKGSATVVGGPPGSGKTILTAADLLSQRVEPSSRVLYFNTLSEPAAKTLRYLKPVQLLRPEEVRCVIQFVDLGVRSCAQGARGGLQAHHGPHQERQAGHRRRSTASRSSTISRSLQGGASQVRLRARRQPDGLGDHDFLLGEYGKTRSTTQPALLDRRRRSSRVTQREQSGEQQRFLQIVKMRGTEHSRDEHAFVITTNGIEVFAPRVTIDREDRARRARRSDRCKTGIPKLDELLGEGIPRGSSLLIAGVAGTGKTVLLLEFLYRGAQAGEKGIMFSFEETEERLRASARGARLGHRSRDRARA